MPLRFSEVAWKSWEGIIKYYTENYGAQAIRNLTDNFEAKVHSIEQFPESGTPEPLASDLTPTYRFFYISTYLKVIYYVDYVEDCIKVADIWDARMSPQKLRGKLHGGRRF